MTHELNPTCPVRHALASLGYAAGHDTMHRFLAAHLTALELEDGTLDTADELAARYHDTYERLAA